ncbi:phage virion morphogenesis protein [Pasteurella multocida]|uniref:phage virion morphogenesis protein n=1 Tax=Pasteurella multocida TaxID=747 RepID=UPI0007762933|nr:phage virion morphogenesis protein [Pasteurella multocida]AMM81383.1 virion morphogenesis protein [Pasteurella multocida subsp. multocida PMTB2.1]MDY0643572.1 phage virion morphogenesis protein [Pasteurella multocida]
MHLEYKFETQAIQNKFKKLSELGKTDGLTRKIAGVLQQEAETAFDNERSPIGEKWSDLNTAYKKQRYEKGYNGNILQVRGDLVDSLNIDYGESFALVGVSEHYGQYHQEGTNKMNARPFLGLGDSGVEEIQNILNNAIRKALSD